MYKLKTLETNDGLFRISVYYDECSISPRDMTDEPLHCEDWSRDFSIMTEKERKYRSANQADLIGYLLSRYGDRSKIIKQLKDNAKAGHHEDRESCLMYVRERQDWVLYTWYEISGRWFEECYWNCGIDYITLEEIVDQLSDDQISNLCNDRYFTDKVKISGYDFGYGGHVQFHEGFGTYCDGIAWIGKDEFLKYSGCPESYWQNNSFMQIEWLTKDIEAWSEGEVYYYDVEKGVRFRVHRDCLSEEREPSVTEEVEWESIDTCGCLYGDIGYAIDVACDNNGLKRDDFHEVA